MLIFLLAAVALVLAAILWYTQASGSAEKISKPPPEIDSDQQMHRLLPDMMNELEGAVRLLEAVMLHPTLGGPGFLLVQFPSAEESAVVTAQYPNIREELYQRILRQELDDLAAAGLSVELLSRQPAFEAESCGIVLISISAGRIPEEIKEMLSSRKRRSDVLHFLAERLRERFPELSVRMFGTDLLLAPVQREKENAVTSIDE